MAKLTDVRDTPEIANGAKVIAVPVKGGTTIYQGALVALDASGYAIPGKKAESLTAVGRAEETVTNTGADGELVIRVARGVFVFDNTATSANKITAAHVLKPCYMEDDHTVTALATGASVAGTVIRVDDEGVAVECGGYIPAAAAASVGGYPLSCIVEAILWHTIGFTFLASSDSGLLFYRQLCRRHPSRNRIDVAKGMGLPGRRGGSSRLCSGLRRCVYLRSVLLEIDRSL